MNSFPLYDNLKKDIIKKDLTMKQKEELCLNIKKLDNNAKEIIYVLIQYYSSDIDSTDGNIIPYNAEKVESNKKESDITWSLSAIPIPLRQILYNFVNLHNKKQKEEIKRNF